MEPKTQGLWGWKEQTCQGHHEWVGSSYEVCHTQQQELVLLCLLWCLPCFFFLFFFPPDILQSGSRYWTRRGALTVHEEWRLFTWNNGSGHPRWASSYYFIWQKASLKLTLNLGRLFLLLKSGMASLQPERRAGLWLHLSIFYPFVPDWNLIFLWGCKRRTAVPVLISRLCCSCRSRALVIDYFFVI